MNQPADVLWTLALIIALVGAFMLRMAFELWQYRRNAGEVLARFVRQGADSPAHARPLEEMGLRAPTWWHFGLRDYRAEALRVLIHDGSVQKTFDGRYYLSYRALRSYVERRGR